MRIIFAVFLVLHGIAHLVGFFNQWKIVEMEDMPYKTTIFFGRFDLGDIGIRIVGVFWLAGAILFIISAYGLFTISPWWQNSALYITLFSTLLCVTGLPDAKVGLVVNVVIIPIIIYAKNIGILNG